MKWNCRRDSFFTLPSSALFSSLIPIPVLSVPSLSPLPQLSLFRTGRSKTASTTTNLEGQIYPFSLDWLTFWYNQSALQPWNRVVLKSHCEDVVDHEQFSFKKVKRLEWDKILFDDFIRRQIRLAGPSIITESRSEVYWYAVAEADTVRNTNWYAESSDCNAIENAAILNNQNDQCLIRLCIVNIPSDDGHVIDDKSLSEWSIETMRWTRANRRLDCDRPSNQWGTSTIMVGIPL